MASTGKTSGVSTVDDTDTRLLGPFSGAIDRIIIRNDDPSTAAGYWKVGTNGEYRPIDANEIVNLPLSANLSADYVFIARKVGGANLANVRAYTLP